MAQAQSLQWNGGTADWSSANWVNNPTYGSGGSYGAYWNSQATVINNGGTVNITAGVNNGDASSTGTAGAASFMSAAATSSAAAAAVATST